MSARRSSLAVLVVLVLAAPSVYASNEDECRIWCGRNPNCEKCSTLAGCGIGYKQLQSFRGRGRNWFACESSRYGEASRQNQRDCEAWCSSHENCDRCRDRAGCGAGYRSIETFGGRGKNWHACELNTYGADSRGNQQDCEAWCREQEGCVRCSEAPACGAGQESIKTFGGRGKNWYACRLTAYGEGSRDNRQECQRWCAADSRCDKCSELPGCGPDCKMLVAFRGQGKDWYACRKRKDRREDCLAWCAASDRCDRCSKDRDCGPGLTWLSSFDEGLGPSYYACGNTARLRERFRAECEAFCRSHDDCSGCVQGLRDQCTLSCAYQPMIGLGPGDAAVGYWACRAPIQCRHVEPAPEPERETGAEIREADTRIYLTRRIVFEGNVPYTGSFPALGTVHDGHLLSLELPSDAARSGIVRVSFLRAGESTTDCTRAGSIVTLEPGQSTSASDLEAIFLTESPPLPIGLLACALASAPVDRIPIVVRYSYRD